MILRIILSSSSTKDCCLESKTTNHNLPKRLISCAWGSLKGSSFNNNDSSNWKGENFTYSLDLLIKCLEMVLYFMVMIIQLMGTQSIKNKINQQIQPKSKNSGWNSINFGLCYEFPNFPKQQLVQNFASEKKHPSRTLKKAPKTGWSLGVLERLEWAEISYIWKRHHVSRNRGHEILTPPPKKKRKMQSLFCSSRKKNTHNSHRYFTRTGV